MRNKTQIHVSQLRDLSSEIPKWFSWSCTPRSCVRRFRELAKGLIAQQLHSEEIHSLIPSGKFSSTLFTAVELWYLRCRTFFFFFFLTLIPPGVWLLESPFTFVNQYLRDNFIQAVSSQVLAEWKLYADFRLCEGVSTLNPHFISEVNGINNRSLAK